MKKFIVLVALVALSSPAFALITNSGHDFSGSGWTADICAPCHTPHNAVAGAGPLWAHSSAAGGSFTIYSSSTMNNAVAAPAGISLACLSCHDGATAMDAFIGTAGAGSTTMGAVAANLGTDLGNDHPVQVTLVDGADADIETINNITAAGLPLDGAVMTCATCHDVHNGTGINTAMLRVTPAGSAICLACHIK